MRLCCKLRSGRFRKYPSANLQTPHTHDFHHLDLSPTVTPNNTMSDPDSSPLTTLPPLSPSLQLTTLDQACALTPLPFPTCTTPSTSTPLSLPPTPTAYFTTASPLPPDWCIGLVPHGGFLATFLVSAGLQFLSTLHTHPLVTASPPLLPPAFCRTVQNHSHAIRVAVEFLRRATAGVDAVVRVRGVKFGTSYSVLGVSLFQLSSEPSPSPSPGGISHHHHQECCTGYITYTNMPLHEPPSAITFSIPLSPSSSYPPIPIPIPSLPSCLPPCLPPSPWRRAKNKLTIHPHPSPPTHPTPAGITQHWVRWADYPLRHRGFIPRDLPFLCDIFQPLDTLLPPPPPGGARWYPTLGYEVELKALPGGGARAGGGGGDKEGDKGGEWEWLFIRANSQSGVRGGRASMAVEVYDQHGGGGMVARAGQVALVVGGERNLRGRGGSKV